MSGPAIVVRAAVERLNANDLAGYSALMADDIVMVTESRTLTGREAVTAEMDASSRGVSNHWITVDRLVVSGDRVATWLTLSGESVRTGMPWQVEGCTVWETREGSITAVREYCDWSPMFKAFDVVGPTRPSGGPAGTPEEP